MLKVFRMMGSVVYKTGQSNRENMGLPLGSKDFMSMNVPPCRLLAMHGAIDGRLGFEKTWNQLGLHNILIRLLLGVSRDAE